MSKSAKKIVSISTALLVLLSLNTLSTIKASALEVPLPSLPLGLDKLPEKGIKLGVEPSLNLIDESVNRNSMQMCVLPCELGVPTNLSTPQTQAPQPQPRNLPPQSPLNPVQGIPGKQVPRSSQ